MVASYNGWSAAPGGAGLGVKKLIVNDIEVAGGVRGGPVYTVMRYVAEQFNKRVERLYDPGCWGGYYKNSANSAFLLSCHASWTAIDLNAPDHPNGKRGTFNASQVREIRAIQSEVGGVVYWGGDRWGDGVYDEMHFEIATGVTEAQVATVAARLTAKPQPTPEPEEEDEDMACLLQAQNDPKVYLVAGGTKTHVTNEQLLADLQQLHKEGTLKLGNGGKVRVVRPSLVAMFPEVKA